MNVGGVTQARTPAFVLWLPARRMGAVVSKTGNGAFGAQSHTPVYYAPTVTALCCLIQPGIQPPPPAPNAQNNPAASS